MDSKKEIWFGKNEYGAIKNGCDVIIQDDINSIKKPKIYLSTNLLKLNNEIYIGLRKVLEHSMKRSMFKYGETGYVILSDFKLINIPIDGTYNSVSLTNSELVRKLEERNLNIGSLICLHNHPNNTDFSYTDILNFLYHDSISAIVIVGNTHNVFSLRKCYENNINFNYRLESRNMQKRYAKLTIIDDIDENTAKNIISNEILKYSSRYNLEFKRFKRGI